MTCSKGEIFREDSSQKEVIPPEISSLPYRMRLSVFCSSVFPSFLSRVWKYQLTEEDMALSRVWSLFQDERILLLVPGNLRFAGGGHAGIQCGKCAVYFIGGIRGVSLPAHFFIVYAVLVFIFII